MSIGSVFASWSKLCSWCLCCKDPLLNQLLQLLFVSPAALGPLCAIPVCVSGTTEVSRDVWVWGQSGPCRLQSPIQGFWGSLIGGGLLAAWIAQQK